MSSSGISTTTIGSYPKPEYVPIRDWFDASRSSTGMNDPTITLNYSADASYEAAFVRAAQEVIDAQVRAGVDVVTDGEVRRENYIHYHCRHLAGFDFDRLETKVLRDGAYETDLPAIRSDVGHPGTAYSVHDWKASQDLTDRPVKFTLPGPLTIMDTVADCHYDDRKRLNAELAETVNAEVLALAEAGCKYIQVDEPLFARNVKDALDFGMEGLERCFHGLPNDVTRVVHMCCGYPEHLDDFEYKKADPDSYQQLANAIDEAQFDQISIEDAHCKNDLNLLQNLSHKIVVFGAVAVAQSRVESVEEITERLKSALKYIDRDRLIAAPDCGLGLLTPELAQQKLSNLCAAARSI